MRPEDETEPTGRFMAGTGSALNWRTEKSRTYLVIWDRGKPSVTDLSRSYVARVNAVNSAGVAVGTRWDGVNRPNAAWVYRDGQVRNLAMPSGHRQVTPVAINERGDILGMTGLDEADSRALVVWPAGSDESPRVVEEQVHGEILDWAEDGTLTEWVILGSGADVSRAVRVSRPDGSAVVMTAPDGWGMGIARPVRGAWIAGTVPGTGGERTVPALWNTSTNQVFVYHGLDAHHQNTVTVDANGQLLARKPGDGWYLVEQDGTAQPLPLPPGTIRDYGMGPLVIDDEGVIQGSAAGTSGERLPTAWRCR
ncbi:hypothetical protein [Micromonospora narathiwatensis]|uniref:Lipoprotein LpqB beta-propeller domain-containing protein n=1 Tax=Micromonospora narathiwatensis TaxID=299146 RepID=A0A1A9A9D4_9ACTN|nr:hypothetical protein [Micromonospora narathiwatensis]SBT52718.1 hypothetical protein GA0070621_4515 [Micromonospora narathiwatensis]